MHLKTSKKGCQEGYGNLEAMIAQRDKEREEYLKNYKKKYNELNAEKIRKTEARKYSENSDSINQKRREKYKLQTIAKRKNSNPKAKTKKTGIEKELKNTDKEIVICKGCNKEMKKIAILNHVLNVSTTCESTYDKKEIQGMLEKKWAKDNKYQRDYYKKKGDEKRKRQAEYYKKNKEAIKEKKKEHYAANRWKIHEIHKKNIMIKIVKSLRTKRRKIMTRWPKRRNLSPKRTMFAFVANHHVVDVKHQEDKKMM